jgi:hypothetical protein
MIDTKALARHYANLTPEERFRLILAAGARGDEAERSRLVSTGQRITLSIQDHAPYAHAFEELSFLLFIELLEEAARYLEAFARADDVHDVYGESDEENADGGEVEEAASVEEEGLEATEGEESEAKDEEKSAEHETGTRSVPPLTVEGMAADAEKVFRQRVEWWGG